MAVVHDCSANSRSSRLSWSASRRAIVATTSARCRAIASAWRCASPMLVVGEGRFGDERLQLRVICLAGEVGELLVDDRELLPKLLQATAELGKAALDQRARHLAQCRRRTRSVRLSEQCETCRMAVDAWGITDGYWSSDRVRVDTTPETRAALLQRWGPTSIPTARPSHRPRCGSCGRAPPTTCGTRPTCTSRTARSCEGVKALPPDLPLGYHHLIPLDGWPSSQLVVAPARAHPVGERVWGWAAQLYAARSRASWGIGDLGDLARLARWSSSLGRAGPGAQPAARRRPRAPAAAEPLLPRESDVEEPARAATSTLSPERPHRATSSPASRTRVARSTNEGSSIATQCSGSSEPRSIGSSRGGRRTHRKRSVTSSLRSVPLHGDDLRLFAIYCALAERHGGGWQRVATELSLPEDRDASPASPVSTSRRVRLHMWLQWQLDVQLARAAASGCQLVGDLAVGFDPGGADAWMWQDLLALDARVGAPPDGFNVEGQDWGLPPFVPWKLRAAHFDPFIKTVRAAMRGVERAARRPRHGSVPPLLDPAGWVARRPAPTSNCRRARCSTCWRSRARERARSSSVRTSARSRTRCVRTSPIAAS